jgi:methyl coenzyme M reductase beta subunit
MSDEIDLYGGKGNKLASGVPLGNISPLKNAAIKKIVNLAIRTGAVDLAGLIHKHLCNSTCLPWSMQRIQRVRRNSYPVSASSVTLAVSKYI